MGKKGDKNSEEIRSSNRVRARRHREKKRELLDENIDMAWYNLKKMILFDFVQKSSNDICYRCGEKIIKIDDLSIDHKEQWIKSDNPRESFYDLNNIAYSHTKCNYRNEGKQRFNINPDSKRRGVTYLKKGNKRWRAQIKKNGKSIYIGCYETEKEAMEAYDKKATEFWSEEAVTNKLLGFLKD